MDLYSPSWYRVAALRPRLRSHVRIHRHHYRGELWYVLEDMLSRRVSRFTPVTYFLIGLMDGKLSVQEIWDGASAKFGDDAPTQDEMIRLLGQLHSADVIQSEAMPDVLELLRRAHKGKRKTWLQNLLSPLSIRLPLFDPDRLLERWLPWVRPCFGGLGLLLWCAVVGLALASGASHWGELTDDLGSRILAPQNLLLMWLVFPVLKLLHEFGHAFATKVWGGEVHEMGVMLLVLMPVPYVDATSAATFPETWRRVLVGAAGMLVEVFVASLALLLWLSVEPGLVRAVLYNVILIAGVSTVVFNANPLLRFDGYYMLSDLIQVPNLRTRANQYLAQLVETRLFGVKRPDIEASASERRWFVFFAIASFFYRNFVTIAIALFIATQYFVVGVALAIWAVATAIALPIVKAIAFVVAHPRLRRRRLRAVLTSAGAVAACAALLFYLPVPLWTHAQGVIWVPDNALVRAGTDGFVREVVARPGSAVTQGTPLLLAIEPTLQPRIDVLQAQLELLQARAQAERMVDLVRWELTRQDIKATSAQLEHATRQAKELLITSPAQGTFVLSGAAADWPDRFVRKGQQLGYVVAPASATARVLVSQDDVDLVRSRTRQVAVKLVGRLGETFSARVLRETPAASNKLTNLAMSSIGGGNAPVDPRETKEPKTLVAWFEFELEMPSTHALVLGEHVYARFEHGDEALAWRLARTLRQLFMRQFAV